MPQVSCLKQVRQKYNLSVRALSKKLGIDSAYLSRVECNKVPASRALIEELAKSLKLDRQMLMAMNGHMPEEWQKAITRSPESAIRRVRSALQSDGARHHSVVAESLPEYGQQSTKTNGNGLHDPLADIFPPGYLVSPQINEAYELKLAALESANLTPEELLARGGYFLAINGQPTNHFRICTGASLKVGDGSSARLQSFMQTHQFKGSYATHGLFPYRGKFHPQMIKAIINVIGIKPGDVVLDPMMGSGTTCVEASIMGIDSVGVDVSPFCDFMTRAKLGGLTLAVEEVDATLTDKRLLKRQFEFLSSDQGQRAVADRSFAPQRISRASFDLIALAYLDSQGYARRSQRKNHEGFFNEVLERYLFAVKKFQKAHKSGRWRLGTARTIIGDGRHLELKDASIDGVVFSPPYSFALDYLENDASQLDYLGFPRESLSDRMVGLRGKKGEERVELYFQDMTAILSEAHRVLKPARYCVVVVGSNSNQLAAALGLDPESEEARLGIENRLTAIAAKIGMRLDLSIRRLIVGMANSMREEHILFLRKSSDSDVH
ncbi:MAG TPA: hypothetical protein DD417_06420 [Elusimicrobia bacterium]|nr:hypothetical protein [Elusimicrobiota bacterium]